MSSRRNTLDVSQSHRLLAAELPTFISRQVSEARRYYFELNPESASAMTIVLGGWERVEPDYAILRPRFPFHSIEFVAEGRGLLTLGAHEHELAAGSVFCYGPNTSLSIRADPAKLMLKYYVTFMGDDAERLLTSIGMSPCGITRVGAAHEIREIMDLMLRYGLSQTRYSQALCGSLIRTLFYKIAEQELPSAEVDLRSWETYRRLRDVLDATYLRLKNVQQVATACGVTVPYVCRLFQRFDHLTPYQYLMRHKMKHAADLLSHPAMMVKQVAGELGFADQYQFSRAFKRTFGLSPAEFRKRLVPHDA